MPPKHAEQDQIDAKWLGKKNVFWRERRKQKFGEIKFDLTLKKSI